MLGIISLFVHTEQPFPGSPTPINFLKAYLL